MRDCTTCGPISHLSIVQFTLGAVTILRAFSRHHRMSDPVCCSFQHHLHLKKKFRCFGWQSKLLLCLQLAQVQTERLRALDFLSLTASCGVSFPPAVSCGWLCSLLFIGDASLCHFLKFWNKNFIIPELLENQ